LATTSSAPGQCASIDAWGGRTLAPATRRAFGLHNNVAAGDEAAMLPGGERQSVEIGRTVEAANRVILMESRPTPLSVRERVNEILQLREQDCA
jgi:ABC-type lipopolysaccharide export system ATPase subunit